MGSSQELVSHQLSAWSLSSSPNPLGASERKISLPARLVTEIPGVPAAAMAANVATSTQQTMSAGYGVGRSQALSNQCIDANESVDVPD